MTQIFMWDKAITVMLSSRKNGDTLYIMSNKYFYGYGPANPGEIIPMVKDTSVSQSFRELPINNIMCYPESISPQYLMVAAVDIMKTDEPANIEAILGSGSTVYMNDTNLYVGQKLVLRVAARSREHC